MFAFPISNYTVYSMTYSAYFKNKIHLRILIPILCLCVGTLLFLFFYPTDLDCCFLTKRIFGIINLLTCALILIYLYKVSNQLNSKSYLSFTMSNKWLMQTIMVSFFISLALLVKLSWYTQSSSSKSITYIHNEKNTTKQNDTLKGVNNCNDSLYSVRLENLIERLIKIQNNQKSNGTKTINNNNTYTTNIKETLTSTNDESMQKDIISKLENIEKLIPLSKDTTVVRPIQIINNKRMKIKNNTFSTYDELESFM